MKIDRSLGLLGVLLEPTTVVTKAWEQVLAVGQRAFWKPRTVLVTGAGPIGLLAALVGIQHGLEVPSSTGLKLGLKPELVRALGATYHTGAVAGVGFEPDVIVECTGVGQVINDAIRGIGAGGVVCLTGVGTGGSTVGPPSLTLRQRQRQWQRQWQWQWQWQWREGVTVTVTVTVLKNNVVVGSVDANKRHWYKAGQVLARADRAWLARLLTRREPPETFYGRAPAASGRHQSRH